MPRFYRTVITISLSFFTLTVLGGLFWGNTLFARNAPMEKAFFVPWMGGRTLLQYGIDPYGEQATERAQLVYYDRLSREGEDPLTLSVPMPLLVLYLPFCMVDDYAVARGLWMTAGEIALIFTVILSLSLSNWKPRKWLIPLLMLFVIFWVYSFRSLVAGSSGALISLGVVGALAALKEDRDDLAGGLLTITFFQPAISIVFLVFLLFWTISNHRLRIWRGFLLVGGFVSIISFLLLPSWFLPFIRNTVANLGYSGTSSTIEIFRDRWPEIGQRFGVVMAVFIGILLFIELRRMRGRNFQAVLWTACLVITATPLLAIPTTLDGHILLFLPLVLLLSILTDRWRTDRMPLYTAAILVVLFLLLWISMGSLVILFVVSPLIIFTGLYWIRWWSLHPPRTWVDTIRQ